MDQDRNAAPTSTGSKEGLVTMLLEAQWLIPRVLDPLRAIQYVAQGHVEEFEAATFLRDWYCGNLVGWPEFIDWLRAGTPDKASEVPS